MKRVGIFGGTFNPIHSGHLKIAQKVLKRLNLEKIIFVPSFIPPHKIESNLAGAKDRLKMVKLAVKAIADFQVCDWEIKRKGTSYTVDTLKQFRKKFGKKAAIFFIIGSDSLKELKKWKDISGIRKLSKLVVVNRPGFPFKNVHRDFIKVLIAGIDTSSSGIRRSIRLKKRVANLLPARVSSYIKERKLYS